MGWFCVREIEVDPNSISKTTKCLLKLHNFSTRGILFALNKLRKAYKNDYPEHLPKQLFTEKSHFVFDQLTYYRHYTIFRKLFFPFRCQSKIIYKNNVAIIIEEIKENSSESDIKRAINDINQSCRELRSNDFLYKNARRFSIKFRVDNKVRIHKIILQNTSKNSASLKNNLYYIHENHDIIHILNKKDYYFTIHRLLSPIELHHYLCFRAWLCERKLNTLSELSEQSILGQYLIDEKDAAPDKHYECYAKNLDVALPKWEIVLSSLYNATIGASKLFEMEYHFILSQIAQLRLDELILFRDQFINHYENIKNTRLSQKTEIDILLPLGFIFIEQRLSDNRELAYPNHYDAVFKAYCHEHRVERCVAIIFTPAQVQRNKTTIDIRWIISSEKQIIDDLNSY